jgi:PAS domain S-box-containing protein
MSETKKDSRTKTQLLDEIAELRLRLDEAEQTLDAIRTGNVDALVVSGPLGEQVFSLTCAEQVYRVIIEAMNEGALTMDLGGYILFCNRRFSEMVKMPMEAIVGKRFTNFAGPAQQPAIRALVADAQAGPVRRHLVLQVGGSPVSVQLSANLLIAATPPCICIVTSDLTELEASAKSIRTLRENQQALEESRAELLSQKLQLEAANKELESFSYSVSHDLRAPLRAIDGYSRMILRKHAGQFDEDALDKFNVIRDSTRMMGQLIEDLLAFSRLSEVELSSATVDIGGMIREVWEEIKAENPDRRLTLKIGDIPPCRGDRALVRQVLVNILSNAVKFTRSREEALIEAGGESKEDKNLYYIRDNGIGFEMQYHDKMFGVFQRLHGADEFEGTGVGLAIVRRIIHRHGGRVWAEGEIDKGACFYFSLPA